jgi:hypothetical protein
LQISTILNHIDSGHMALPEFQRGYVWNRDQVKGLFDSLYRRHPIGGLLVWVTESKSATHRGEGALAPGVVKLLLDGQQRITTLYGVVRGHPPKFFDGNADTLKGLYFHLESEEFSYWQPVKMRDDPLWMELTSLFQKGTEGLGEVVERLGTVPSVAGNLGKYVGRLSKLLGILDIDLHIEEVTGPDKTIEVVVDIFNRVNSGGTKLSKGDLALAKICADWPEARDVMKGHLAKWHSVGYEFSLDWLLRSVNTILTGEAKFQFLHDKTAEEVEGALARATKHINTCLNLIEGRLGLDHNRVLFGRYGIPVMVRFLEMRSGVLGSTTSDKLLFWFVQSGMWGRFSGSTETYIDQDLAALERSGDPLDNLLEQLRLWQGSFVVEPDHFAGTTLGARFYPVLYMLTRVGEARDWGLGVPLKQHLHGKMSRLEVHHIFPRSRLYKAGLSRNDVNSLANFCFLTKETNLDISDRLPEDYFPKVEEAHPGALASQWIPMDPELWQISRYKDFLVARRELLAQEANTFLRSLLHGDTVWLERGAPAVQVRAETHGGLSGPEEQKQIDELNAWVAALGLPRGEPAYEHVDPDNSSGTLVIDLAWPEGLQAGLSQPVAVLLEESSDVVALASGAGYRCFTDLKSFKNYVLREVLPETIAA